MVFVCWYITFTLKKWSLRIALFSGGCDVFPPFQIISSSFVWIFNLKFNHLFYLKNWYGWGIIISWKYIDNQKKNG